MNSVWILTSSYNDYDQHGDYFIEVYPSKPSLKDLKLTLKDENLSSETFDHILKGGGRQDIDYVWFYLIERKF